MNSKFTQVSTVRPIPLFSNGVIVSWYVAGSELFNKGERTDLACNTSKIVEQSLFFLVSVYQCCIYGKYAKYNSAYLKFSISR